jgi:uncharacterized membrane protein
VEEGEIVQMARDGRLKPEDLVWNETMGSQWIAAGKVPVLFSPVAPPLPNALPALPPDITEKTGPDASNSELMRRAREALSGKWGIAIAFIVLWYLVIFGLEIVASFLSCIGVIALYLVLPPMTVGATAFFISVVRRNEPSLGQMWGGFRAFGGAVGSFILMMLISMGVAMVILLPVVGIAVGVLGKAGLAIGGGRQGLPPEAAAMLPLIIALGVIAYVALLAVMIWIQLRFALIYPLLADYPALGPIEVLRRSAERMRGRKWKMFCLYFRFFGWSILALLTCGIGFLWLGPYMFASYCAFYDEAMGRSNA